LDLLAVSRYSRRVAVFSVHLEHLQGFAGGHVGGLEGDPQWPHVATEGRACQRHVRYGGVRYGNFFWAGDANSSN
jgi:hypothetical protein